MFQSWDHLLFLHWALDPEVIQASLPPGLWVDTHEGQAYLAIVPFFMKRVRPRFCPAVPYLSHFLECNVRTYVHDAEGVPGVWFSSLDTNRWLAYWIARRFFRLPYHWAQMKAGRPSATEAMPYTVRRRSAAQTARYSIPPLEDAVCEPAQEGTLEYFLLERYLLYAHSAATNRLYRGRVHHSPYQFVNRPPEEAEAFPFEWNGLPTVNPTPDHCCQARCVDVEVFPLERA